jgi:hypothetical protein
LPKTAIIVSMGNPENTVLYATWAVKVKEY